MQPTYLHIRKHNSPDDYLVPDPDGPDGKLVWRRLPASQYPPEWSFESTAAHQQQQFLVSEGGHAVSFSDQRRIYLSRNKDGWERVRIAQTQTPGQYHIASAYHQPALYLSASDATVAVPDAPRAQALRVQETRPVELYGQQVHIWRRAAGGEQETLVADPDLPDTGRVTWRRGPSTAAGWRVDPSGRFLLSPAGLAVSFSDRGQVYLSKNRAGWESIRLLRSHLAADRVYLASAVHRNTFLSGKAASAGTTNLQDAAPLFITTGAPPPVPPPAPTPTPAPAPAPTPSGSGETDFYVEGEQEDDDEQEEDQESEPESEPEPEQDQEQGQEPEQSGDGGAGAQPGAGGSSSWDGGGGGGEWQGSAEDAGVSNVVKWTLVGAVFLGVIYFAFLRKRRATPPLAFPQPHSYPPPA